MDKTLSHPLADLLDTTRSHLRWTLWSFQARRRFGLAYALRRAAMEFVGAGA